MNKLLISVATCGIPFAAPIPSAESGLGASETTTIEQVKLSKMMMKKKKMMAKNKMM